MKVIIILQLFNLLLIAEKIHPITKQTSAAFLKIGVGPRAIGMGESFCAIADDPSAIYWNPAGTFQLRKFEILAMHTIWFQNITHGFIGGIYPLKSGNFAAGLIWLNVPSDLERRSGEGEGIPEEPLTEPEGRFGAFDISAIVNYSKRIREKLDLGINLKFIHQRIDVEKAYSLALDMGGIYRIEKFRFGLSIKNFGSGIKFIEKTYPLPLNFTIATAYTSKNLIASLEINQPIDNFTKIKIGTEYNFLEKFYLRTGYRWRVFGNPLGGLSGLTIGMGVKISDYQFDYAFVPYGILGNTHRISMLVRFGKTRDVAKPARISMKKKVQKKKEVKQPTKTKITFAPIKISERGFLWKIDVLPYNSSVTKISIISSQNFIKNVEFNIEESDLKDDNITYEIMHNLLPSAIKKVEISIKIPKKWLSEKNINPSKLKLIQQSKKFQLKQINETEEHKIFQTTIQNLNPFSISAK